MSTILSGVRAPLAAAFSGLAANVFNHVPESVPVPAIVIIPDTDYLEPTLIDKSNMTFKINLVVSCAVAYNSNAGSLDNLEQLVLSVLALIPNGYELGSVQRPTVMQVGASTLLVSDMSVSTYYTQTI
jgi:hypothetical protein